VQWKAILSTANPVATPTLNSIAVKVSLWFRDSPGMKCIQAKKFDNEEIIYSSYNFIYQRYEEPKVKILREQEKLDEVVKKANSEFEEFVLLREWVAKQWKHTESQTIYAPWDALTILEWMRHGFGHGQDNPNGFCVHFSQVYCQCCLAMGLQARLVVLRDNNKCYGGHFVCEVWSNEFKKWIMMDPDLDVHFEKDGIPLNVLELHNLWLRDELGKVKQVSGKANINHPLGSDWSLDYLKRGGYRYWGIVLRNDQLPSLTPGPVEHGWVAYHWNGFLWWSNKVPFELPQFALHSNRTADFYWTLDQVTIDLYYSTEPGELLVQLTTFTPNFDKFLVKTDDKDWEEKPFLFKWILHEGRNKLLAKVRNKFGVNGIISSVEILYKGKV